MTRYKLLIEYDGTSFCGWQRQRDRPSIQQTLEEAFEKLCQRPISVFGAGRTDAGVHALGQVAHVDLPKDYSPFVIQQALDFYLRPYPIAVIDVAVIDEKFHARFSATSRTYCYKILNRYVEPALNKNRVWHVPGRPLNVNKMQEAADLLIGHHDFSTFRAQECQASSPYKTLDTFQFTQDGPAIECLIKARSFLHHQVRNMVGTLKLVGQEKWSLDKFLSAFQAKDRRQGGPTASPQGLYLVEIGYAEKSFSDSVYS